MNIPRTSMLILGLSIVSLGADPPKLTMTSAIACKSVTGYENYVELPGAALTSEDKLLVYYRPLNYKIETTKAAGYHAHLVQEARIRRRCEKTVIWSKPNLLEYEAKKSEPLGPIYLNNAIALKNLKPGDYDLDIILQDKLGETTVSQVLKFQVVPIKAETPEKSKDMRERR